MVVSIQISHLGPILGKDFTPANGMRLAVSNPVEFLTNGIAFYVTHSDLEYSVTRTNKIFFFFRLLRVADKPWTDKRTADFPRGVALFGPGVRVEYADQNKVAGELATTARFALQL